MTPLAFDLMLSWSQSCLAKFESNPCSAVLLLELAQTEGPSQQVTAP